MIHIVSSALRVDLPDGLGAEMVQVPVRWMGYDQHRAKIPTQPLGAHVSYELVVIDAAGNESTAFGSFTVEGVAGALNGDGFVNGADLASLLAQWGSDGPADFTGDNVVNGVDLAFLLANWAP